MNFGNAYLGGHQFYPTNWQQNYSQLLFFYYQLSENYRIVTNRNIQLTQQLKSKQQIFTEADKLLTQNQSKIDYKKTLSELSEINEETNKEIQKNFKAKNIRKSRSQRKSKAKISNRHTCTYADCSRCYDSSVSLNLHIKLKHNGGTKKQRQTYAKMILDAEEKGLEPPKVSIEFPPNFLQDFRISYKYMKKYSM